MDSPVVLDTASEFGRGIDLDCAFPNFPFDDVDTFGRRRRGSDIRSHLDDLASRHPEFADHLLGSAWGDIPAFHNTGSLRNPRRRRGSGSSSSNQGQHHQDEDARSHTSGSSANSAASGASGVSSSRGDRSPNVVYNEREDLVEEEDPSLRQSTSTRRNPIPQYGLRNTVDIGQHRHDMENPVKTSENRGQRSMSAPPENRQQNDETSGQSEIPSQNPPQNQRFVSRVDITPQFVPPSSGTNEKPQKAQNSTNQQTKSNVRHIPIFVEGRDEPVVPKNLSTEHDGPNWSSSSSTSPPPPPKFQQSQFPSPPPPPQFHRPSHFNQHYTGGRARDWLPSFDEEFYSHPNFSQSGIRKHQTPSHHSPFESQGSPPSQFRQRRNDEKVPQQQRHHQQQQQPQQNQQRDNQFDDRPSSRTNFSQQSEVPPQEPRKQTKPKDPLEKVAEVQKEVDSLNEQVSAWNGKSRKDKDYMYLDEMLTRELIKLDDIETEGRDEVRQARKNAIKSIQNSISLLESKAPLNDAHNPSSTMEIQQDNGTASNENIVEESIAGNEAEKIEDEGTKTSIALPSASASSPTKEPISEIETTMTDATQQQEANNGVVSNSASQEIATTEMDTTANPVVKVPSQGSVDTRNEAEITKNDESTETSKMETENPAASPKSAKKIRKTKKQQQQQQQQAGQVCDNAIPLPGPEIH